MSPPRRLRRDAQRHRDAIITAARQVFCDQGLDGFRADRASPLPEPPLSPRQVYRAMLVLGRRSAGDTDQPQPRRRSTDEEVAR